MKTCDRSAVMRAVKGRAFFVSTLLAMSWRLMAVIVWPEQGV
jgi:hypothetical protein